LLAHGYPSVPPAKAVTLNLEINRKAGLSPGLSDTFYIENYPAYGTGSHATDHREHTNRIAEGRFAASRQFWGQWGGK